MAVYKFYDGTNWVELAKKSDIPSLTGYATETWVGNNYLPLSGGTITGKVNFTGPVDVLPNVAGVSLGIESANSPNPYISLASGTGAVAEYIDFGTASGSNDFTFRMIKWENHNGNSSFQMGYDDNHMITVPTGAGTMITDFNIGSYAITSLDSCIKTTSSSGQLITSTSTDTPLRIRGSTGDTYLEFQNSSGTSLGFLAVLGTHKPSFYYNGNHEIALVENVVNLSSSGSQFVNATNTNVPMCFQGSDTGSCVIGFYNSNQTGLGFIGVKSGNVPYFYNPVSQQDHNIIIDSDLGDQVTFSLSGTQLTITRK